MDNLHKKLAERLRRQMEEKGYSINRLADFSGIGRGHLSEILSQKMSPTLRTLSSLAAALGVPVRELLPEDEPPPNVPKE